MRARCAAVAASLAALLAACSTPGTGDVSTPSRHPASAAWQIVLDGTYPGDPGAEIYEIDGAAGAEGVAAVRAASPDAYAVCYLSAGSWEEWRDDADAFPASLLGNDLGGWPGERYVDLRALDALAPIWEARVESCAAAGFDAIDPDNIDAYAAGSGFPLTADDAAAAFELLAAMAHERGLGIAQKNAPELAARLVAVGDLVVSEQCFEDDFCDLWAPYLDAGKPVLDVEYAVVAPPVEWCDRAASAGISLLVSPLELDALGERCPA